MIKFLKKCAWFLVLLVLFNSIYIVLLICFSPGFKKVYDVCRFKNQNFQCIVLGNSMALDAVDAKYLSEKGITTFNLAIAGNHVSTSFFMLEEYLKHNKTPKFVLVGLSSAIGESYLNQVSFTNPEVEFFYHPSLFSNIKNPPLLNFQWLVVDFLKIIISKDHRNAKMILGQWQTAKVIPDASTYKSNQKVNINYNNTNLLKIITLCKQHNMKLILCELSGSNSNQNSLPFENKIQLKNGEYITIYNLNNHDVASKIINAKTDWLAPDHLNKYGGKKQTKLIETIIKKEMNNIFIP